MAHSSFLKHIAMFVIRGQTLFADN